QQIQHPIYFLRGDHDEVAWLHQLSQGGQNKTIPIDPFDLFHYVPDGTIMHCGGMTLAFFGGVEHPERGKEGTEHDPAAFTALLVLLCSFLLGRKDSTCWVWKSQRTRSWKSQSSTWRCTPGSELRLTQGEKASSGGAGRVRRGSIRKL